MLAMTSSTPRTIAFDVNETLLDLRALREPFQDVFGDPSVRTRWFQALLRQALVTTVTGPYVDFTTLGRQSLEVVAEERGHRLTDEEAAQILGTMRELPPHEDVSEALGQLSEAGVRLVALSNGTPEVLHDQLAHAGIATTFDAIFSAHAAGRLKPAPEPYEMVAEELGISTGDLRMVAAHPWDTTGAQRAGCAAAFVARRGKRLAPSDPVPKVVGEDLREVAHQIVSNRGGS